MEMPDTKIEELLAQPVLARLAVADPATGQPHVVPVWFLWDENCIWISAFSSTQKVKLLHGNSRAAVLVEPDASHPSPLQAVLIKGNAEIIDNPRDFIARQAIKIYAHYLGEEGAQAAEPQSWAYDPENRILRIQPKKILSW